MKKTIITVTILFGILVSCGNQTNESKTDQTEKN